MPNGKHVNSHTKLAWGPLAAGYGQSVDEWQYFESIPQNEQNEYLSHLIRGGKIMAQEIRASLQLQTELAACDASMGWFGLF